MPKASLLAKDFVETGLGFGEGWGKVVGIVSHGLQFPASRDTGTQVSGPGCFVKIAIERTDEKGKGDGSISEDELKVGDLDAFRPGRLKSPDDTDVKDLGGDDAGDFADWEEGNSIFSTGAKKINKKAKFAEFCTSLQEAGFKPEVIGRCYLPDMVGMVAHFTQKTVQQGG